MKINIIQNFIKSLFYIKDFDNHYIITLFGIKVGIRHKCNFKYQATDNCGIETKKRTPQLIVSLTSFPMRINTVHLSINTLLKQTLKPDKLILWLAEEQFPNKEKDLPRELCDLKTLGLEIRWCEDLKSYKKLIPALKEFPNDIIITADDDIYYESDWLDSLFKVHTNHPQDIICQRARRLVINDNKLIPLSSRKSENLDISRPDYFNQMLGGTGCLYPPNSLYNDICDLDKIKRLLPTNDDIYFWAMAILNRTKIGLAKGFTGNIYQMNLKESSLGKINSYIERIENKDPFEIIMNEYPQIIKILKEEV